MRAPPTTLLPSVCNVGCASASCRKPHSCFPAFLFVCYCFPLPRSPEVLDPATVCVASLPLPGVTSLSLSADQLLLAAVTGTGVQVYSLPHLLHHQSDAPVASLDLGRDLVQFSWCPDDSGRDSAASYLALTCDRVLLHGSLVSGSAALADGVECAAWSPDGQHIAYSSGSRLVVTAPDWKDSAFTVNSPAPEGEGEGGAVIDGNCWCVRAGLHYTITSYHLCDCTLLLFAHSSLAWITCSSCMHLVGWLLCNSTPVNPSARIPSPPTLHCRW